ncbi:MAG: glycosyltransferase family 4 protein [Anaerolineae bacterium]
MTDRDGTARDGLTVLHCRASFSRHGPEQALDQLAPALRRQGVESRVLALYRPPEDGPAVHPWVADIRAAGLEADQIADPGPLSLGVARRLRRRIIKSGADILHTHDYKTNVFGGLAARRADRSIPWVATVHLHTTTSRRLRLYRALDLFLLRLADRVITVSRDQRRSLLARGLDRRRVVLIPNVIDAASYSAAAAERNAARASLGLSRDAPVVLTVGRLTEQKGLDDLLSALVTVREARPDARLLIAGDGPDRESLEQQARGQGLGGTVTFLGYRDDVPSLLAASDVFALASRAEGLPMALLEAMALGVPAAVTAVGGVPDVVRDGVTGLLVPPGDPDALAHRVLELIGDAEMARSIGAAAQQSVRRSYAPDHAARLLAATYRAVLAEQT